MQPRLVIIEYLFELYNDGKSLGVRILEDMKCPTCGSFLEETINASDYSEPGDANRLILNGHMHPVTLINHLADLDPSADSGQKELEARHIGDIILNCKNESCWTEAFFKRTAVKELTTKQEIEDYIKKLCGISSLNVDNETPSLASFFTHT